MKHRKNTIPATFLWLLVAFSACTQKKQPVTETASFTKTDSVTERYLELQDSILMAWNVMINDDNRKFRSMHKLLRELMKNEQYNKEELMALEQRLSQVSGQSFTPENVGDPELVEEYDFASSSLVTELVSLAESHADFAHNSALQKIVEEIKTSDQLVDKNRLNYDAIVYQYNRFLETNENYVKKIDEDISLEKKPLFQMVAED